MQTSVLLSVKPEFAEAILDGRKTFEFRRKIFRDQSVRRIVLYASAPVKRVVGEFTVAEILAESPRDLWRLTKRGSGIEKQFFYAYFEGRDVAFALAVSNPRRYDEPLDLAEHFGLDRPPQSFRYMNNAGQPD